MKSKNMRLSLIINILSQTNKFIPANQISRSCGVSTKTTYKDLKNLASLMQKLNLHTRLQKKVGQGFKFQKDSKEEIEELNEYLNSSNTHLNQSYEDPQERRMRILIALFKLKGEGIRIISLVDKYYVTSSSIKSDLVIIDHLLKKFKVHIFQKNGLLRLEGKEVDIQRAIVYLLNQKLERVSQNLDFLKDSTNLLEEFTDSETINAVRSYLLLLPQIKNNQLPSHYIFSLMIILSVLIERLKLGHHIKQSNLNKVKIESLTDYSLAYEASNYFAKIISIQFQNGDIQYLSEEFYANGIKFPQENSPFQSKYKQTVETIVNNVGLMLDTDLSQDTQLKESLLSHIPPMIFRLKNHVYLKNPILDDIKRNYSLLFYLLWYAAMDLENQYNVILTDDEIGFLVIYFEISLQKKHHMVFKKIAIVCPKGFIASELIYGRLVKILPVNYKLLVKSQDQVRQLNPKEISLIISPVKLPITKIPIIYVSPLLTNDDIHKIIAYLLKDSLKAKIGPNQIDESLSAKFERYLSSDLFFVQSDCTNKEQVINTIVAKMVEMGLVNKGFKSSVLERERLGDTGLSNGIAVPHGSPEEVIHTRIAIMTLKKPIRWGVNKASVIMMFAVNKKDIASIREFIKQFFNLLESNNFKEGILNLQTKKEMHDFFDALIKRR